MLKWAFLRPNPLPDDPKKFIRPFFVELKIQKKIEIYYFCRNVTRHHMIISIRLKNFYSIRDEAVLDFTADMSRGNKLNMLEENLIDFDGDRFINIIGLFGSNAAGKSNIIKALNFCRNLILSSHMNNELTAFDYEPFKFDADRLSEFHINFVTHGIEYEYSFELCNNRVVSESLYYYPKKRRAKIFNRENTHYYTHRKGTTERPTEVEASTGAQTLFLSMASAMNRQIARTVYNFFAKEMVVGLDDTTMQQISIEDFDKYKEVLLKALEVSDSDIVDIRLDETAPGNNRIVSYHKENPLIPFDFFREESDGTKRLMSLLLLFLRNAIHKVAIFIDEFDLKLHLRLAEFILDVVRASHGGQFVFTSHNPSLINKDLLRREQVIFVNKHMDGNSEFVPLSDYEGLNNNTDIQKAYLQGRFDAVPYVGDVYSILDRLLNKQ